MRSTEEKSFFSKIKSFFTRLFGKKENLTLPEGTVTETVQETKLEQKNNFIENLRESAIPKDAYLLNIQQEFEDGNITEQDIDEEDRIKLKELYKEQIATLKKSIASYKTRILKLKNA